MATRDAGGGGASGARGTSTSSVSNTAWLVCFSWRVAPPGAQSRLRAAPPRPESESLRRSTAPVVQAVRTRYDHGTPGRLRRRSLAWPSLRTAMTSAQLPRRGPSPDHHFSHGVAWAVMVPLAPKACVWANAAVSRWRGETQLFWPFEDTVRASVHTEAGSTVLSVLTAHGTTPR